MAFSKGSLSSLCSQMEKDGAAEGGANRPDSSSSSHDLNEVKVITTAKQAIEVERSIFADCLVSAEKKCSDVRQRIDAIEATCASHLGHDLVESAFRSSLAKDKHDLISACAAEMEARASLNAFRVRNQIKDPARYPDDRLFHFSLLILFVAIETGVNAFFYEGSSGLLGGAFVALAVSVINMGIAAILGALFRYSNLPEIKHKLVGYGALVGFVLAGFVLNLIFSTFRIQYQIVQLQVLDDGLPEPTTAMLVGALRTAVVDAFSVFHLNFPAIDFMSFTLFFVGFGCSVIAFWKGYTFDDRHPGHGDMDRRHKSAELLFTEAKTKAFDDAHLSMCRMADEVEHLRDSIVAEQRNTSALKAEAQSCYEAFASSCAAVQGELDLLIDTYRAANRATRATSAPGYFSVKPNVIPHDKGDERLEHLVLRIEEASSVAKKLADTHASTLGDRVLQIRQKINDLVEVEFHKHIEDVRVRAEQTISSRGQTGA